MRAYDRTNRTPALERLEEEAGVSYQDIQRGIAETIMSDSVHPAIGKAGEKGEKDYETNAAEKQEKIDRLRKFEARLEGHEQDQGLSSKDTVAHTTMLHGGTMSEESWQGDPEGEKENFVQEELYIHGKVCIADDRVAICGSANINDRVSSACDTLTLLVN